MKRMIILFLLIFGFDGVIAQNSNLVTDYEYSQFRFVGFKDQTPIYQCNYKNDDPIIEAKNLAFYQSNIYKDNYVGFSIWKENSNIIWVHYFDGTTTIFEKKKGSKIYLKTKQIEKNIATIGDLDIYRKTHRLSQGNYFYFSTQVNKTTYLARIDVTEEKPEMKVLPIKGSDPILLDNRLYYKIAYETSKHGIGSVASVYRVKVGDWRNPELLINNVEFRGAIINEHLLSFSVYDRDEWRKVTYDITDSTYIEKPISSLIKYKGKKYQKTLCKNEETGKMQYCYEDIPDLPNEFPHKLDRDIEPNHNYFHLPHTEKPFTGIFITDSLMFFADKEELQNLSKQQLRKLRNAFYAREGYDFNSRDLKEFFSQYEWYINTLERRKAFDLTNDEIYMPPANMERIRLIQSVEKSK